MAKWQTISLIIQLLLIVARKPHTITPGVYKVANVKDNNKEHFQKRFHRYHNVY